MNTKFVGHHCDLCGDPITATVAKQRVAANTYPEVAAGACLVEGGHIVHFECGIAAGKIEISPERAALWRSAGFTKVRIF